MIAVVGWTVTLQIADNNNRNAELIASRHLKAAEIRATRVEKSADLRSRADRDVARLTQIKDIFKSITTPASNTDLPTIKLHISSLEIYGDLALDFLVKIRDIFKEKNPDIAIHAKATIINILQASQSDFSRYDFIGGANDVLNLRTRQLNGFNFSGSTFKNVNLFKAGFNRSTLKDARFENADLVSADFGWADLSGAFFDANTNLRRTNFIGANLKGVKFQNCRNLNDAVFSLNALLNADTDPFKDIPDHVYLELLVPHLEELKKRHDTNADRLKAVLMKVNMDYKKLLKDLHKKRLQQTASAKKNDNRSNADA